MIGSSYSAPIQRSQCTAGHNGVGAVTFTGALTGDKLLSATNLTTPSDVTSSFEAITTVDGQIQQTSATDLSAKQILFLLQSGA